MKKRIRFIIPMNKAPYLLLIVAGIIVSSCSQKESDEVCEIRVSGYHEIIVSSPSEIYGKEPLYIKLQNQDSEDFAFGGIKTIRIRNSHIFIMDNKQKKICVFGMDGSNVSVLDYMGRGPQEYLTITDFDVDKQNNVWIVDGQKDMIFKYSPDFELVGSTAFPFDIAQIHCIDDGSFIVKLSAWDQSKYAGAALLKLDSKFFPEKQILDYPENRDSNIEFESSLSTYSEGIFFNDQLDPYLYHITDAGDIDSVYHFDFGSRTVQEEYKNDIESYLDKLSDCSFLFRNYRVTADFITCGIRSKEWYGAILDRVNQTITYFEHNTSGFILAGQCFSGPVWQITSAVRRNSVPVDVFEWLESGGDVLAVFQD